MNITDLDDAWVTFSLHEELLKNITTGSEIRAFIPALDNLPVTLKVYYIKDMGTYAAWKATKSAGQYDAKTFEVRARPTEAIPNLRPGMSVIIRKKGNELL
jgi:HlyD family secretion protein